MNRNSLILLGLLAASCQSTQNFDAPARSGDANTLQVIPSQPVAQHIYQLRSVSSGQALDVAADQATHGSAIVQSAASDSNTQRWTVVSYRQAYQLVNLFSGMCLNIAYQSVDVNAPLQQWDCNTGTSEQWDFVGAGDANYLIVNVNSNQAVDSPDHYGGTTVVQAPNTGAINEQWQFTESTPTPGPAASGNAVSALTMAPSFALSSAVIYNVFPEIFSPAGNFDGVTVQLPRLQQLGVNTLFIMPVTVMGKPTGNHPAFGSPYCVHDFYAINPNYGTSADFKRLVDTAHRLGFKVLLDEVLNHSAWDNALITAHPEYYVHTDNDVLNSNSIAVAFSFNDVAQFDYKTPGNGLAAYMTTMLTYWLNTYGVDGFRFDTADDPDGSQRMITQAFWTGLRASLQQVDPNVIMFGEEENVDLALAPFALDYGWNLQSALRQTTTSGNSVAALQSAWAAQSSAYPQEMLHASLLQDWDLDEDLSLYGGALQTMDAAVFNSTLDGVPMIFNGEEVANASSGINTHQKIAWNGPQAPAFSAFYTALFHLRNQNPALQQGALTWLTNSAPAQVASYTRALGNSTFLVLINFGATSASFTVQQVPAGAWQDVTPTGAPGGQTHPPPTRAMTLQAYDFAVFSL